MLFFGELSCEPFSGIPCTHHQTVKPAFFPYEENLCIDTQLSKHKR